MLTAALLLACGAAPNVILLEGHHLSMRRIVGSCTHIASLLAWVL